MLQLPTGTSRTRLKRALAGALTVTALAGAAAEPTLAGASMETILQDDAQLLHQSDAQVDTNMAQIRSLGVTRVRITAGWSTIAPSPDSTARPDFDATDPAAYPPHVWENLDRATRLAAKHGLKVDIDVAFWAPVWATKDATPGRARTYIAADEYAKFATAVAKRYSGAFVPKDETALPLPPPSSDGSLLDKLFGRKAQPAPQARPAPREPLPRVDMYTIWNEPNLKGFVTPQWVKQGEEWVPESPHIYRRLAAAGYRAIKDVDSSAQVLVGGTASTGLKRGDAGSVTPLRFIREMACVDAKLRPLRRVDCAHYQPIQGDGWAHHPYSLYKAPGAQSANPEHVTISELDRMTTLLGKLAARGRINARLKNLWLTEYGYETNDEVTTKPYSAAQQARFLAWSEYLAWRNPYVRSYAQFLLRDIGTKEAIAAGAGRRADGSWQSGLYFEDGRPKPAADAFRLSVWSQFTPVRARRARIAKSHQVVLWGHLRTAVGATTIRLEKLVGPSGAWTAAAATPVVGTPAPGGTGLNTDQQGFFEMKVPFEKATQYRVAVQGADGAWTLASEIVPVRVPLKARLVRNVPRR
jgi:hypothetical protein